MPGRTLAVTRNTLVKAVTQSNPECYAAFLSLPGGYGIFNASESPRS